MDYGKLPPLYASMFTASHHGFHFYSIKHLLSMLLKEFTFLLSYYAHKNKMSICLLLFILYVKYITDDIFIQVKIKKQEKHLHITGQTFVSRPFISRLLGSEKYYIFKNRYFTLIASSLQNFFHFLN